MSIAHVSIVTEEYLGFPQWLWFSNCLQTSNSINLKWCIKTCEYFILTIKETCQTEIWKETSLIELCFFFIDILTFEQANYARGGDFASFFDPGLEFCTEKLSLGQGFWQKKLVARGSAGGMVTSQIDTCISVFPHHFYSLV